MPISEFSGLTNVAFGIGAPGDIAIIAVVVLVLFGGSKLATLGKSLGEGIREFKKATKEDEGPATPAQQAPAVSAKDEEK
jgi:sec-independent protein translocase protein TatA